MDHKIRLVPGVVALGAFGRLSTWAMAMTGGVGAIARVTGNSEYDPGVDLLRVEHLPVKEPVLREGASRSRRVSGA